MRSNWLAYNFGVDIRLQFNNIDFALDSKKVVDAFGTCIKYRKEFGCIIDVCRQLFYIRFQNYHVDFNMRQINGVAHKLAHVTSYNPNPHTYDDVSSCIWHILANEI